MDQHYLNQINETLDRIFEQTVKYHELETAMIKSTNVDERRSYLLNIQSCIADLHFWRSILARQQEVLEDWKKDREDGEIKLWDDDNAINRLL